MRGSGGETDAIGRTIAQTIEQQTGWDVVVENKPGGAGIAMLTGMRKNKPDGKTIGLAVNMPVLVNLVLRGDKLPFNLDSFEYLGTAAGIQLAIVARADAPFNTIEELIAYSKKQGGVAVVTDAKPQQLVLKRINARTQAGLKPVVTKGSAEILQFLLGGKAMVGFMPGKHIPYVQNGELKMLASVNSGRHDYSPETRTLVEQGHDLYVDPTFFFMAPKGLSADAKKGLEDALDAAIRSDDVQKIVKNTLSTKAVNLGSERTKDMLVNGLDSVAVLFK